MDDGIVVPLASPPPVPPPAMTRAVGTTTELVVREPMLAPLADGAREVVVVEMVAVPSVVIDI